MSVAICGETCIATLGYVYDHAARDRRARNSLDLTQRQGRSGLLTILLTRSVIRARAPMSEADAASKPRRPEEQAMSVILRLVFVIAGLITALFVARDALHFDLVQTWTAIVLVTVLVGVASLWAWRQKRQKT
jgi:hypothetical protein